MNFRCREFNQLVIGFVFAGSILAQPIESKTGLESDSISIPVVVENLDDEAQKIGLSKDRIEARVNDVLRKNGLKPAENITGPFLSVRVSINGSASYIQLQFQRGVVYSGGNKEWMIHAVTWERGIIGRLGSSGATEVLNGISELSEVFANAFLKANGK